MNKQATTCMRCHRHSLRQTQIRRDTRKYSFSNRIIPLWSSLPEEKTKYHAPILEVITTLCLNDHSRWMICMTSGLDIEDYLRPHWTILLLLILLLLLNNSDNILVTIDICITSCLQLGHCVHIYSTMPALKCDGNACLTFPSSTLSFFYDRRSPNGHL